MVYAMTWGAIGFAHSLSTLFVLTAIYGTSHGLVEGAEKALVAQLGGSSKTGLASGVYNMSVGLTGLLANIAFGAVWDRWGDLPAFLASGCCALAAAAVVAWFVPAPQKQ
jgi:sugar phosphate permease